MASKAIVLEDLGKLLLRVSLGVLILFHGVDKMLHGAGFVTGMVGQLGLPQDLGYLVYVGEVLAPLLLILGLWTRPAALVVAINMLVAVWLVHMKELLTTGPGGGWALELQAMYLIVALAVALFGGGRFAVGGRWN